MNTNKKGNFFTRKMASLAKITATKSTRSACDFFLHQSQEPMNLEQRLLAMDTKETNQK